MPPGRSAASAPRRGPQGPDHSLPSPPGPGAGNGSRSCVMISCLFGSSSNGWRPTGHGQCGRRRDRPAAGRSPRVVSSFRPSACRLHSPGPGKTLQRLALGPSSATVLLTSVSDVVATMQSIIFIQDRSQQLLHDLGHELGTTPHPGFGIYSGSLQPCRALLDVAEVGNF